jgi:hypothetical protein
VEDPENVDYLAVELVYEVLVLPVAISVDTGLDPSPGLKRVIILGVGIIRRWSVHIEAGALLTAFEYSSPVPSLPFLLMLVLMLVLLMS